MDAFNEIKLMFIAYHIMCFTPFVTDPLMQYNIGYSCFVFMVIGLAINMIMLFVAPFALLKRWCKIWKAKKKARARLKIDKPKFEIHRYHARRKKAKQEYREIVKAVA